MVGGCVVFLVSFVKCSSEDLHFVMFIFKFIFLNIYISYKSGGGDWVISPPDGSTARLLGFSHLVDLILKG